MFSKKINGKAALVCTAAYTTSSGAAITSTIVMVTDGITEGIVNFTYMSDNANGSLAQNLQACIDSVTILTEYAAKPIYNL